MKKWSAEEDTWLCESLETRGECAGMKVPKQVLPQPKEELRGACARGPGAAWVCMGNQNSSFGEVWA